MNDLAETEDQIYKHDENMADGMIHLRLNDKGAETVSSTITYLPTYHVSHNTDSLPFTNEDIDLCLMNFVEDNFKVSNQIAEELGFQTRIDDHSDDDDAQELAHLFEKIGVLRITNDKFKASLDGYLDDHSESINNFVDHQNQSAMDAFGDGTLVFALP